MKRNDLKEVKTLEIKDLQAKVKKAKEDLAGLFMSSSESTKDSKDVKVVFKKRKDLAQMMTILRQKQIVEELRKEVKP